MFGRDENSNNMIIFGAKSEEFALGSKEFRITLYGSHLPGSFEGNARPVDRLIVDS